MAEMVADYTLQNKGGKMEARFDEQLEKVSALTDIKMKKIGLMALSLLVDKKSIRYQKVQDEYERTLEQERQFLKAKAKKQTKQKGEKIMLFNYSITKAVGRGSYSERMDDMCYDTEDYGWGI